MEKVPSARDALTPSGAGDRSSGTSVKLILTVEVAMPPLPSSASTIRV